MLICLPFRQQVGNRYHHPRGRYDQNLQHTRKRADARSAARQGATMEFFRTTLDPVVALAAIAVLDIFLFLIVGAWTVGGSETMMTGLIAQAFLGDDLMRIPFWNLVFPPQVDYWKIYISLGMFF